MRHTLLSLGAAAAMAAGAPAPAGAAMFNPETFTLDNGMEVVVVPNRRAPVVSHYVWYKVGSADSPIGQSGIAHFLEHLMFKGTTTRPAGDFSKTVARNGGNDNAFTSQDYTAYFQNIARDRLELVMTMEADRMANLSLKDEEVLPERSVIEEERRSRVDNDPGARLSEAMGAAQFLHHPYRVPVIGWASEIAAYDREAALAFYRAHYAPNNAVLVVAGDVNAEELRPLAERTYGRVPARPVRPRDRVQEPPQDAARRVVLSDPRVGQPSLIRTYTGYGRAAGAGEHAHPLQVLAELFGGTSTSRLYRALVIEQKLAVSAGASYRPGSLDLTTFRVYASPRPGVTTDALEAALDAEIEKLLKDGVTAAEAERAKSRMIAESVYARDSLGAAARAFGVALTTGRTVEDVEAWPDRVAAVTPEAIDAAARAVLVPGRSVTGLLLRAEEAPAAARSDAEPAAPRKAS